MDDRFTWYAGELIIEDLPKEEAENSIGYNPYRDSDGKFDDGLSIADLKKFSTKDSNQKKIDQAKKVYLAKASLSASNSFTSTTKNDIGTGVIETGSSYGETFEDVVKAGHFVSIVKSNIRRINDEIDKIVLDSKATREDYERMSSLNREATDWRNAEMYYVNTFINGNGFGDTLSSMPSSTENKEVQQWTKDYSENVNIAKQSQKYIFDGPDEAVGLTVSEAVFGGALKIGLVKLNTTPESYAKLEPEANIDLVDQIIGEEWKGTLQQHLGAPVLNGMVQLQKGLSPSNFIQPKFPEIRQDLPDDFKATYEAQKPYIADTFINEIGLANMRLRQIDNVEIQAAFKAAFIAEQKVRDGKPVTLYRGIGKGEANNYAFTSYTSSEMVAKKFGKVRKDTFEAKDVLLSYATVPSLGNQGSQYGAFGGPGGVSNEFEFIVFNPNYKETKNAVGDGYNPYRDSDGKFDDGLTLVKIKKMKRIKKPYIGTEVAEPITTMSQAEAEMKLVSALEDNGIQLKDDESISDYINAIQRKIRKEIPENNTTENVEDYLESKEFRAITEQRHKRFIEIMDNINSSMGINTKQDTLYVTEQDYDNLVDTEQEFRIAQINFYKTGAFSLKDGRVKIEIAENLQGQKPKYWYDSTEEKQYFDSLVEKQKFIEVDETKMRTLLSAAAERNNIGELTFPAITQPEVKALEEYNLVSAVNQGLRNGKDLAAGKLIQSAIDKTYTRENTVYRGVRGEYAESIKNMTVGDTITDIGFMSTSQFLGSNEKEGARKFGESGAIMEINTPAGFGQGIDMGPYVGSMSFMAETEILLNRNTTLQLVGFKVQNVSDKDGTPKEITIMQFNAVANDSENSQVSNATKKRYNPYRDTDGKFDDGLTIVEIKKMKKKGNPYLFKDTLPDYNLKAPEGWTILYTNTKPSNIEKIKKEGLKVGMNPDAYKASPEEGDVIWTDTRSPESPAYGGNTIAFIVPTKEAEAYKVNDTQHTIPHDIPVDDILFIDVMLKVDSNVKVSSLPKYVERYGRERTAMVIAKTGDGIDEKEVLKLIDMYEANNRSGDVPVGEVKYNTPTPGFDLDSVEGSTPERAILWRDKILSGTETYGEYYKNKKGIEGDIFMLTPKEYKEALVQSGQYESVSSIDGRMDRDKIKILADAMREGKKFTVPSITYDENKQTDQEGLHRTYAAEEAGIERIPVTIIYRSEAKPYYLYDNFSDRVVDLNANTPKENKANTVLQGNAVLREENEIRYQTYETFVAINGEGNTVAKIDGSNSQVEISGEEIIRLQQENDLVTTHNHPNSSSFSNADIATGINMGAKEIRVTSALYDYRLRYNGNTPDAVTVYNTFDEAERIVSDIIGPKIASKELTIAQANEIHYHEVNLLLTQKLGFEYERISAEDREKLDA